ncbi:MAG: type II toxin-antitoxin system VapC family toxin [Rhodocyclaceae bacterium]|nr:type II toxin-antitoxin system VapC family toxin [Rhodocyclaceae bacterium]MDZ4216030.1 type II toxin-antitoxin system VapC family toxin [Rhodocyclaceae bacterium]
MFVLDTNAVIHFFKGKGRVADRLLATPPDDVALPAIVLYELERGARKQAGGDGRIERLARFIAAVHVLPFDQAAARHAAEIALHLESLGQSIGPMDTLIAATALAQGATLVTHNTNEFARVPGLKIDDWF